MSCYLVGKYALYVTCYFMTLTFVSEYLSCLKSRIQQFSVKTEQLGKRPVKANINMQRKSILTEIPHKIVQLISRSSNSNNKFSQDISSNNVVHCCVKKWKKKNLNLNWLVSWVWDLNFFFLTYCPLSLLPLYGGGLTVVTVSSYLGHVTSTGVTLP